MSIADRISSMANNLSSAYGRIEYLGVDTSSIDKNIQNLSTVLDTVYNDYPKVSDEGTSPSIEGSKVGRLSTTLKGNTSQDGTPTPDNPVDINVVKGNNSITVSDGDSQSETYPINLPTGMELCKIGDYQDKLFKAIVGDTIYDSLTSEQKEGLVSGGWYKYEYIKRYILNGSEDWDNTYGANVFHIDIAGKKVNSSSLALTNHYVFDDRQYGMAANLPNGKFAIQILQNPTKDALFIKNTNYDNPTNFKNSLVNNNLYLYYPLATPNITQITDTTLISQLNALYNAMSYNGQTNILQTNADLPFIISASALKGA